MDGSNNPPSRGGGRNRNRGKRNKRKPSGANSGNNNNNNHNNANKKPSIPPPPQTKITLRNIQNFEKYGSVEQVFQLVTTLLEQVNTAHNSAFAVELEMGSVRRLIQEEELVKKAQQQQAAKTELQQVREEEEENEAAIMEEAKDGEEREAISAETTDEKMEPATPQVLVEEPKEQELQVIVAPKKPNLVPVLTLRPLYVVPPRKTRRRGERGGCAYLVLTAPKIEPIEPPPVPEIIVEEEKGEEDKPAEAEKPAEKAAVAAPSEEAPVQETKPAEDAAETTPEAPVATETSIETADTRNTAPAPTPTPTPVVPTVDYSGAVAKGRLILVQAIEALEQQVQDDSKGPHNYAGCIVEPSVSGKTWRHQYGRVDRRENSIETTADYKNWLQSLTQQREDLKARPKPAPGGGGLSTGEANENGMPISAIVAHLRAKRQEAKRKKAGKKKKDKVDTKPKGGGGKKKKDPKRANASGVTTGGRGGAGGGAAAAGAAAKKKKKKTIKKKAKVGAAPTLLKAPAGG
jgi:hypothetical protein